MRFSSVVLLLMMTGILLADVGCAKRAKDQRDAGGGAQISEMRLEQVREKVRREYPNAVVGRVIEVIDNYAAVGDINPEELRVGQVITFTDAKMNPLVSGEVRAIVSGNAHVRFEAPARQRRAPRVGDLAMRL